jgi:predicted RNA-binding protein
MCEFSVQLGEREVFKDVIYAKAEGNKVTLKDVLGASKVLENCKITEINVTSERLVLSAVESS